jgi:peroxiredoxin
MGENNMGQAPSEDNLMTWVDNYSLTFPVLSDERWVVSQRYEEDGYIPSQTLIGPGMEIIKVDDYPIRESAIQDALP